jgi:hypothetical protein
MIMQKCIGMVIILGIVVCRAATAQQNPPSFTLQTALSNAADAPPATVGSKTGATPTSTISPAYHDAQGRVVVSGDPFGNYGMRYDSTNSEFSETVDVFGNRSRVTKTGAGTSLPVEIKHEFNTVPVWYERFVSDTGGALFLSSVDKGDSTLGTKTAPFGIQVGYPDWLKITFRQASTINEVDVITLQDNSALGIKPLRASEPGGPTTFTAYGTTDYEVQYVDPNGKWVMIPGTYTTHNRDVARAFTFAPITTTAIRLVTKGCINGTAYPDYTRIVEVEAFEQNTHRNVALATQGATATASSDVPTAPAIAAIDGDETGKLWGNGGGWRDNTPNVIPAPATVQTSDLSGGYSQTTYSNQFANVVVTTNNNPQPTFLPMYQSFMLEKNDMSYSGHSFGASMNMTGNGIEYWDSSGGSRIQYYDNNKKMFYVSDWCDGYGTQPVVRVNRDTQGRPTDVYLGSDVAILQFSYDDKGWRTTRLIDRTTNTDALHIRRPDTVTPIGSATYYPVLPTVTRGYFPHYGPIIEWQDKLSATPTRVCTLKGSPYALLPPGSPTNGRLQPVRWVIFPFSDENQPMTNIRVDYSATDMYVYVPTLNSGSMIMGQDAPAFHFSRYSGVPLAETNSPSPVNDTLISHSAVVDPLPHDALSQTSHLVWQIPMRRSFDAGVSARDEIIASSPSLNTLLRPLGGEWEAGQGGSGGAEIEAPCGHGKCGDGGDDDGGGDEPQDWGDGTTIDVITIGENIPYEPPGWGPDPFGGTPGSAPSNPGHGGSDSGPCADNSQGNPGPPHSSHPSDSQAALNQSSAGCGACTPSMPNYSVRNCNVLNSTGMHPKLKSDVDWALRDASVAMQDPQCSAFLHDPAAGSYFHNAGYDGYQHGVPALGHFSELWFQDIWRNTEYYDGSGSCQCPEFVDADHLCGGTAFTPADHPGFVFVCGGAFDYLSHQGFTGGETMILGLLHEFLHNLGLNEDHDGSGHFPTTFQINTAVAHACGGAAANAMGNTPPP